MDRSAIEAAIRNWQWPRPIVDVRWNLEEFADRPVVFLDTRDLGDRKRTALWMPVHVQEGDAAELVTARIKNAALTARAQIEG